MAAKGKWAQGIPPRNFAWIMKDRLAVSERPGGYGANHRRVRRQEEIIWVREQGFSCVVSIIPAPHNLHNYDELGVTWRHRGFDNADEPGAYLTRLYPELQEMLAADEKILLHADGLGDAVCGILTGYLVWTGLVPHGPEAVTLMERMVKRQLGPYGRDLVRVAAELPSASPAAREALAASRRPRPRPTVEADSAPAPPKKAAKKSAPTSSTKTKSKVTKKKSSTAKASGKAKAARSTKAATKKTRSAKSTTKSTTGTAKKRPASKS